MRFLIVLALATVALAGSIRPMSEKVDEYVFDLMENAGEIEYVVDHEDGTVEGKFNKWFL